MIIKNNHITAWVLLTIAISGCSKDWLEVKADNAQAIPSTINDVRAMMDNPSLFLLTHPAFAEIASDQLSISNQTWESIKNTNLGNAYIWSNQVPYSSVDDWNISYTAIFNANVVLETIEKLNDDQVIAQNIKGEAYFHRGKLLFGLASNFSPPFTEDNLSLPYGIPLRVRSDTEAPTTRSTIQETYNQILSDLKTASNLLPPNSDQINRPAKNAAIGLLARVYLSMEKYDSALAYANKYLGSLNALLDYNTLPVNNNFIDLNIEVCYLNFLSAYSILSSYTIPNELYLKYEDNDLRKQVFFQESSGSYLFKGSYSKSPNNKFCGIATDEVYLIRAECYARKNKINEAMTDLNTLLKHRYLKINGTTTLVDRAATNVTDALKMILEEREKELILRNVRWSDLRRLNRDPNFAKTITKTVGGETYTLEPGSYKYTFPIPDDIVEKSGISQNPNWDR